MLTGRTAILDAEFLTEFGVDWTDVGMVGAYETGNVMARLFILIVRVSRCGHN